MCTLTKLKYNASEKKWWLILQDNSFISFSFMDINKGDRPPEVDFDDLKMKITTKIETTSYPTPM